jgi:hypothetical protein
MMAAVLTSLPVQWSVRGTLTWWGKSSASRRRVYERPVLVPGYQISTSLGEYDRDQPNSHLSWVGCLRCATCLTKCLLTLPSQAAYGGYQKTGYGQGGDDAGGFLGASQQGSQGGGTGKVCAASG